MFNKQMRINMILFIQNPMVCFYSPRIRTLRYMFVGSRSGFYSCNWVDLTQLARLGGGIYLEPKLYIPGASTLGVSEVEGPLLVLPVTWACSFVCSAVKALSFSVYAVHE
ncbi:hypothetical protein Tco_0142998 [Tanacetum coccineum]